MAYRILNLAPSYRNLQGDATASGGTLYFYETGTATPKSAYTAKDLSGAMFSITLDSAGRTNGDVWGDGIYRVTLKDVLGATIWTRDNVELPGGASQVVPVPNAGEFLTGDGTNFALVPIREVPDPTGQANKFLGTDGTALFWQSVNASQAGVVKHQTVTAADSTTIDLSLGLAVTLNQAVSITTLAFTNIPAGAFVLSIRRVKDNSATVRTITWPASVKWPGGAAPTLSATANAVDELSLKYSGATFNGTYQLAFA